MQGKYYNPIENYDERVIKAWEVAEDLKRELDAGIERDKWTFGGNENYVELKKSVEKAIKDLKEIY